METAVKCDIIIIQSDEFRKGCDFLKKAAIGLSGGVDSAAAAHILQQQGYDVTGIILRLKPESAADSASNSVKAMAFAAITPSRSSTALVR